MKSFLGEKHRLAALSIYLLVVLPEVVVAPVILLRLVSPLQALVYLGLAILGSATAIAVGILTEVADGLYDRKV